MINVSWWISACRWDSCIAFSGTHTRTCTHTHMYTYIHTHAHWRYAHTHTHACICAHTHKQVTPLQHPSVSTFTLICSDRVDIETLCVSLDCFTTCCKGAVSSIRCCLCTDCTHLLWYVLGQCPYTSYRGMPFLAERFSWHCPCTVIFDCVLSCS